MVPVGAMTSARVVAVKARVWLPIVKLADTGVLPLPLVTSRAVSVWLPGLRVTSDSLEKGPPFNENSALASPVNLRLVNAFTPVMVMVSEVTRASGP